jgi:adenine phosphoribosyltransferase
VDVVVGIEARGFFFAPAIAYALGAGFVPVRKPGKLPAETETIEYALEYGTDKLQIHKDAIQPGMRVLIIDDVLATGGTASAVAQLIERLGAQVLGLGFLVELDFLNGKAKLEGREVYSVLHY